MTALRKAIANALASLAHKISPAGFTPAVYGGGGGPREPA